MARDDDDPSAPYKVYAGDTRKGAVRVGSWLSLRASPLLFGGVGDLHSTILAGKRIGWILQM
jgi:hypothetical protein